MNLYSDTQPPSGLKLELIASFAGTGWAGLMQVACIPAYIKLWALSLMD